MPKGYLIYNPAAGRYPSRILCERAATELTKRGWVIRLEQTQNGEHITELAQLAVHEKMDAFFLAGGDGSINYAIAGLMGSKTALGVLPSGTANVWAQELGLPGLSWTRWSALEESARRLANAQVYYVDIGICNQRPFLLWAGVGLDAFIVHLLEPRSRWEKHFAVMQYAASAIWQASIWHGMNLRVYADGREVAGHFLLAIVSNIHLYAGGLAQLSPYARLDDNTMDLWLFEGESLVDTVQHAWELWSGNHIESKQVQYIPFHYLILESESPMFFQTDGEPNPASQQVIIQVKPNQLPVLIPENPPHILLS